MKMIQVKGGGTLTIAGHGVFSGIVSKGDHERLTTAYPQLAEQFEEIELPDAKPKVDKKDKE